MVLIFLISAMLCSFGFILFFCEFGQRVSAAFENIHDTISLAEWYAFPLRTQKLLPVMMIVAEHQISIKVFGNISCVRETFKTVSTFRHANNEVNQNTSFFSFFQVVNGGFSYFTMLRQFGK